MRGTDPGFRGEIFEDEPDGRGGALQHRGDIALGEPAAERLDDDVGSYRRGERLGPAAQRHAHRRLRVAIAIDAGGHSHERREVVQP